MTAAGDRVLPGFLASVEANAKKPGGVCWYQRLVKTITPEDRADLDTVLAREDVAAGAISLALRAHDIDVADVSVRRHRQGKCTCQR